MSHYDIVILPLSKLKFVPYDGIKCNITNFFKQVASVKFNSSSFSTRYELNNYNSNVRESMESNISDIEYWGADDLVKLYPESIIEGIGGVNVMLEDRNSGSQDCFQGTNYKLLHYKNGGHFKIHRDANSKAGLFATGLIHLPRQQNSKYKGGLLIFHSNRKLRVWDPENYLSYTNDTGIYDSVNNGTNIDIPEGGTEREGLTNMDKVNEDNSDNDNDHDNDHDKDNSDNESNNDDDNDDKDNEDDQKYKYTFDGSVIDKPVLIAFWKHIYHEVTPVIGNRYVIKFDLMLPHIIVDKSTTNKNFLQSITKDYHDNIDNKKDKLMSEANVEINSKLNLKIIKYQGKIKEYTDKIEKLFNLVAHDNTLSQQIEDIISKIKQKHTYIIPTSYYCKKLCDVTLQNNIGKILSNDKVEKIIPKLGADEKVLFYELVDRGYNVSFRYYIASIIENQKDYCSYLNDNYDMDEGCTIIEFKKIKNICTEVENHSEYNDEGYDNYVDIVFLGMCVVHPNHIESSLNSDSDVDVDSD